MDPFGVTCDPRLYVPRLGTEAALTALREGLALGRSVSVLSGPPGLGKTMVLQVLARQLAGTRCALVPYAALGIEELAHYALDLLGERTEPARATIALAASARRGTLLTLLIDDASALPIPTARALREIVDSLHGALRVVAAIVDDTRASAVIAALGEHVLHVRLRHPLAPREVRDYVHGRIARAGAAFSHRVLGPETIDRIAAISAGVPRVVNMLATWLLADDQISRSGQHGVLFDGFEQLDEA